MVPAHGAKTMLTNAASLADVAPLHKVASVDPELKAVYGVARWSADLPALRGYLMSKLGRFIERGELRVALDVVETRLARINNRPTEV